MIETMAYAGEVPWHGLGVNVDHNLSSDQMLDEAGLNWQVTKERVKTESGIYIPNRYALLRSTDKSPLGICSAAYKPIQNDQAFDFFNKFVKAGRMTMETAGSLDHGKRIWGLARLKSGDFELANNDKIEGYILLSNPHIPGHSMTIMFTPIRVVCNNTLTMALSNVDKNAEGVFRLTHHKDFDEQAKKLAEYTIGLSSERMKDYKETAEFLSKKRATDKMVSKYFVDIFGNKNEEKLSPTINKLIDIYHNQPGSDMSPNTWWQAFNAVTYFTDHVAGRAADSRMKRAWFGNWASLKRVSLHVATEYAKKSRAA